MSYARLSEGDVYVFEDVDEGKLCCMTCLLVDNYATFWADTHEEMLGHLLLHVDHDHDVPARAFERLLVEARE